jgi:hypothetical protein
MPAARLLLVQRAASSKARKPIFLKSFEWKIPSDTANSKAGTALSPIRRPPD